MSDMSDFQDEPGRVVRDEPCRVCSRSNSRFYYKGQVCNACRVFFYRAVCDEPNLICEKNKNCRVHYSQKRFCLYCRYQKCKAANMKVESVNKRVKASNRPAMYYTSQDKNEHLAIIYGGILGDKPANVLKLNHIYDVVGDVDKMTEYNSYIFRYGANSPSWSPVNASVSLLQLLQYPESCIDKNTAVCDIISKDPMSPYIQYNMPASVARSVVATIEMLNIADTFRQLGSHDKAKLVQRGCTLLITFVLRYEKYMRGIDDVTYYKYLNRFRATQELPEKWMLETNCGCYRRSDELFVTIQPTEEEMVILRLIGLVQSYPELSVHGIQVAVQTKLRMTYLLEEYLVQSYPELTRREILERLRGLLEIGNLMKEIRDTTHASYFQALVQCGFTQTTLGYDLFVRQF